MTKNDAIDLIYSTVQDATLLGYLGAGEFWKSSARPDNAILPCMTIRLFALGRRGEQHSVQQYQAVFSLFTDNADVARQPDYDLSGAVEARLNTLFHAKTLTSSAGKIEMRGENPVTELNPDAQGAPPNETIFQYNFNLLVFN